MMFQWPNPSQKKNAKIGRESIKLSLSNLEIKVSRPLTMFQWPNPSQKVQRLTKSPSKSCSRILTNLKIKVPRSSTMFQWPNPSQKVPRLAKNPSKNVFIGERISQVPKSRSFQFQNFQKVYQRLCSLPKILPRFLFQKPEADQKTETGQNPSRILKNLQEPGQ